MESINIKEIKEKIERLNFLYLQSKTAKGLTLKEQEEQGLLREFILKIYKENLDY